MRNAESGRVGEGSGRGILRSRMWGGGVEGGSMRQRKALFLVRRLTHNTKSSTLFPCDRNFGLEIRKRAHILRTSDGRSLINLFESQRKGS